MLFALVLLPFRLYGVEILDADPELTTRFSGRQKTDEQFGSEHFFQYQSYNHLLGTIYYKDSRETVLAFGFRLTESFCSEWKEQGEAQVLFNIIEFHEGDARKICPIQIERLASTDSPLKAAAQPPVARLGSIAANELQVNRLYSYPLPFDPTTKPGDIVWIGLDGTNPVDSENHNLIIAGDLNAYPGGSSPMMIAGSLGSASKTIHGISLLQSLNRLFYAPKNAAAVPSRTSAVPRWINPFRTANKLETLEVFRLALEQKLARLPESPVSTPDHFKGFHSSIKPEDEGWELLFPVTRRLTSIALYPAVYQNGRQTESYAFPKRFTITAIPRERDEEPVMVADWSQTDFPQQGLSPVIFPFAWINYEEVRVNVIKGVPMSGGHAFALSEVSFPRRYSTWPIDLSIAAEDSLESPPYWSAGYATDGRTVFGSPTPAADAFKGTFRMVPQKNEPVQIIIRVEQPTLWNGFEFHPTQHPDGLPPEGFPKGFLIEFSDQDDFSDIVHTERSAKSVTMPDGKNPFALRFPAVYASCVRITLDPPAGDRLQLEEITFNGGLPLMMKSWYMEKRTISGTPGTAALYDRIVNGNYWDPPVRRSVNLIRRDVLVDELQRIENTVQAIHHSDKDTKAELKASAIILAALLSGLFILHQRRQSKKAQLRIRHRIQQDLHDEIGSQLSTISMITNFNRNDPNLTAELRTEITDANQCAREAIASLAEVIWLTDKEILTLDQCFDVMKKRAEKMVHTMTLDLDFPRKVPPLKLSYRTKRNLILLFTEALNNGLKHSNADTIQVRARIDDHRNLTLVVADNGQGFAPDTDDAGIGLESMKERAEKLGGKLDIISPPEQGTTVTFRGKL